MAENDEKNFDTGTNGSPGQVIEDSSEEKNYVIIDDIAGKKRLNDKPVEVSESDNGTEKAEAAAEVKDDEVITDKSGASIGVVFITVAAAAVMLALMFFLSFRGADPAAKCAVKFTKTVWNGKFDKAEYMVKEGTTNLAGQGDDTEAMLSGIYSGVYGRIKKVTVSKPVYFDNEQGESCAELYVIVINDSGKAYRTGYILAETEEGWLVDMDATGAEGFLRIKADGSSDAGEEDVPDGTALKDADHDGEVDDNE